MLIIAAIIVISVWLGARKGGRVQTEGGGEVSHDTPLWPQIAFTGFMLMLFLYTAYEAMDLSFLAKVFPAGIATVGLLSTLAVLWPQVRGRRSSPAVFDGDAERKTDDDGPLAPAKYVAWLVGFVGMIALVGYFLALIAFFVAFLRIVAKLPWLRVLALTAVAAAIVLTLGYVLSLQMPQGLLQDRFYHQLVWPFL